jgi:hypothetical protein
MDLTKLIGMVVNTLVRTLVNRGVNAGIDHLARRGKDEAAPTPEEKAQAQAARDTARRARQAAKLVGKIGKPRL